MCNGQKINGFWSPTEVKLHINILELKAVFNGLTYFAKNAAKGNILLRVDNTTAISYINKMGGFKSYKLNKIAKVIWEWCEKRKIFIFASYITSLDNKEADFESRRLSHDCEYSLGDLAFRKIVKNLDEPNIDLFASIHNSKYKTYVSWKKDPRAVAIDAFTIQWKFFFYAFPPFCLIDRVLNKIKLEKAEGIVVVPNWKTQAWYPLFKNMIVGKAIYLKPNKYLLLSPSRESHPLWKKRTLVAAILSAKPSDCQEYPRLEYPQ